MTLSYFISGFSVGFLFGVLVVGLMYFLLDYLYTKPKKKKDKKT